MNLAQVFKEAGVTHAHIVDDGFDTGPSSPPTDHEIGEFLQRLTPDQVTALALLLKVGPNEDDLTEAVAGLQGARALFKSRRKFLPASEHLFQTYIREQLDRKKKVRPLIKRLRQCGVTCKAYGPDARRLPKEPPQLIFIDLQLRNHAQFSVRDAIEAYQRIMKNHGSTKPFVFLFSTLKNLLDVHKEEFRGSANIFVSQFEALPKARLGNSEELDHILSSYASALPRLRDMHTAIDHVVSAISAAGQSVTRTLLSLDLVDYFVLHANTVSVEKTRLGTYVSEILMEYLVHEVEKAPGFWDFAQTLDSWTLHDIPRARFGDVRPARDIYSGNMLHARTRLASEADRKLSPAQGHFSLGDIFFNSEELRSGELKRAVVVISPACDLARPEDLLDRTLMLCEGKIGKAKAYSMPTSDNGTSAVILAHPHDAKKELLIEWNKKKIHSWHKEEIEQLATVNPAWTLQARLRPLYALQLQQSIVSDLGRIGVQRSPSVFAPHGLLVFVRDGNVWQSLDTSQASDGSAAALSVAEGKKKKTAFIVTDTTAFRIYGKLKDWVHAHPTSATHAELAELSQFAGILQKFLYAEQLENSNRDYDKEWYPFHDEAGLAHRSAVAFVRPDAGSVYDDVKHGVAATDDQKATLLFKFKRLKPQ
ncbi:hypothetical protein [Stenotrophomonas rhizophila]|uniref:hypothetical protein n=1 Tax=Stenotrophomonas rhizophila TaxID=216778 RepID=UPI00339AE81E